MSVSSELRYSVIVPVYESSNSVAELVRRLEAVFKNDIKASYEILLVDDGSRSSQTWKTLCELTAEEPSVMAIRLMRNYGKPGAVLCGLNHARGRWIITIDDDLQQRPEDIAKLVCYEDHDVVVAQYPVRQHGKLTVLTSWIKSRFDRIILGLPCRMSPLKLFKAEVAQGMLQIRTPHPFIPALMSHVTSDFYPVILEHQRSTHGKSRYTLFRRIKQFSNLLINNSSLLLRVFGFFGGIVAISGFAFSAYVVIRKLMGMPIYPGWSSLVVINLIFGGLILIALSIIGEYLIRILEGSSAKPPYIVREAVGRETRKVFDRKAEGGAR